MGLSSSGFSDLGVFFPLGLHLFRDNPWGKWIWLPLGWRHLEIWILLSHVPKFPTGPVGPALVGVQVTFVKWIVYLAVPHLSTVGLDNYKPPGLVRGNLVLGCAVYLFGDYTPTCKICAPAL